MTENERVEGGRRARAAVAYADADIKDLAKALHMSPATAYRILDGTRKETGWEELWAIADYCRLPREWFGADLSRLSEIVPPGSPTFGAAREQLRRQLERGEEAAVRRARKRAGAASRGKRGPRRATPGS